MHLRRRTLAALIALAVAAGAASSALITAGDVTASDSARYELKLGDRVAIPAIGWECDLQLVQGSASFACNPGKTGTTSQGEPIVSAQWKRVVIAGGPRPKLESIAGPRGATLRIWTFPIVRH